MNYIWFILLSSFWGGSFVAIKFAINNFPPYFDAFLRVGFSLIILWIFFRIWKKNLNIPFNSRKKMWLIGLFIQGIPFAFLFWGERFISPGLAGILNGTVPIWSLILSLIFIPNNSFSPGKFIGLIIGIIGIIIIFFPILHFRGEWNELIGCLALIGMAISYAIGGLLSQQFFINQKEILYANVFHQHCASVVFLFSLSLLFEKWPSLQALTHNYTVWLAIIYLALFSTALGWLMYFWLIQEWGVVRASTVTYVTPIMALLWDFLFFQHIPYTTEVIGVIIILMGVILIQIPRKKLLTKVN